MPITLVTLTLDEYQAIMDRLRTLEVSQAARVADLAPVLRRIQGVESTLSAIVSTVAALPQLDARIAALEKLALTGGTTPV